MDRARRVLPQDQGFNAFPSIAIVVQQMVESEVSGVMFTGNPINTATDELMINASWGLGESVVSGIVTPDEYIVSHRNLKVLQKTLGSKKVQVIRDTAKGVGTASLRSAGRQARAFHLQRRAGRRTGRRRRKVQAAYEGMPQDIEWGYAGGKVYVLQSRPVTGVEFSGIPMSPNPCRATPTPCPTTTSGRGSSGRDVDRCDFAADVLLALLGSEPVPQRRRPCRRLSGAGLFDAPPVALLQGRVVLQRRGGSSPHHPVDPAAAQARHAAQDSQGLARGSG